MFLSLVLICRNGVVWFKYALYVMPNRAWGKDTKFMKLAFDLCVMYAHARVCVHVHSAFFICHIKESHCANYSAQCGHACLPSTHTHKHLSCAPGNPASWVGGYCTPFHTIHHFIDHSAKADMETHHDFGNPPSSPDHCAGKYHSTAEEKPDLVSAKSVARFYVALLLLFPIWR